MHVCHIKREIKIKVNFIANNDFQAKTQLKGGEREQNLL